MFKNNKAIIFILKKIKRNFNLNYFIKFCLVGGFGFFFDLSFFTLFYSVLNLNIFLSRAFSFIFAVNLTWFLNRRYTYLIKTQFKFNEWMQYILGISFGSLINYSVFVFLISSWTLTLQYPIIAFSIGAISGLFFNFNMSKIVFKK